MTTPTPPTISVEADECRAQIELICEREGIRTEHRPDLIESYAVTWYAWRECVRGILDEGQTVQSIMAEGVIETKRNPRMSDLHQFRNDLAKCANELGLSAKARLEVTEPGDGESATAKVIKYKFGVVS
jgi:phage terminase small subunit